MRSIILKIFPIVGMDNEIDYSECIRNVPKFSYNMIYKVFFGLSLNIKYLCKYFFGILLIWENIFDGPFLIII